MVTEIGQERTFAVTTKVVMVVLRVMNVGAVDEWSKRLAIMAAAAFARKVSWLLVLVWRESLW